MSDNDHPFEYGARYRVKQTFTAPRESFIADEEILYWRFAKSIYDGMKGWFFLRREGSKPSIRTWDMEFGTEPSNWQEFFERVGDPDPMVSAATSGNVERLREVLDNERGDFGPPIVRLAIEASLEREHTACIKVLVDRFEEIRRPEWHLAERLGLESDNAPLDWGDGEYEETGEQLVGPAHILVETAEVTEGESVIDVGCGTGNAALIAARLGARVHAIDPAERLAAVTKQRAQDEGLAIDVEVGSAAEPKTKAKFDAAVANFSIIFAPDPAAAIAGVLDVLRPGGRFVFSTWIPTGPIHESASVLVSALGWGGESPWATEESIRSLFKDHSVALSFDIHELEFRAESPRAWFEAQEARHPFWRFARKHLQKNGADYDALRAESIAILERGNESPDIFTTTSQYRVVRVDVAI